MTSRFLILDPGFSGPGGHNGSLFEDFSVELPRRGIELHYATFRSVNIDTTGLATRLHPIFAVHGYDRNENLEAVLASAGGLDPLITFITSEFDQLDWTDIDAVVMPTMYPLHLLALTRFLLQTTKAKPTLRISIGCLMPLSFWTAQPQIERALGQKLLEAISLLRKRYSLLLYSETSNIQLDGRRLELPRLLPPVSNRTLALLERLSAARPFDPSTPLRFGFLGTAFTSKGFGILLECITKLTALPSFQHELHFVLPPVNDSLASRLTSAKCVRLSSKQRSNDEYLTAMSELDVILLPYDPAHYGEKFSGIIVEALALGKPMVVSHGATYLVRFLNDVAPGSFLPIEYSVEALTRALTLPKTAYASMAQVAQLSHGVAIALKNMDRYFAAARVELKKA